MSDNDPEISQLVNQVRQHPNDVYSQTEARRALEQLADIGAPAVRPVFDAMSPPYAKEPHPRDVVEALGAVLYEMARRNPDPLIEIVEQDATAPDPQLCFVVSALGCAGEEHKERIIDVLLLALKHKNLWVRRSAVSALVRLESKRAVEPFIKALSDRSPDVRFKVVSAMKSKAMFRDVRALGPLKRIVDSKSLQKHSPGLCRDAAEVIKMIESKRA